MWFSCVLSTRANKGPPIVVDIYMGTNSTNGTIGTNMHANGTNSKIGTIGTNGRNGRNGTKSTQPSTAVRFQSVVLPLFPLFWVSSLRTFPISSTFERPDSAARSVRQLCRRIRKSRHFFHADLLKYPWGENAKKKKKKKKKKLHSPQGCS